MTGLISSLISTISSAAVVAVKDLYYNYVTLLLHGDGINTAQNNTFIDSSTNALSITRGGSATQGTFSPFSHSDGYWSNYFGNGPYLYNASSVSVSNFGTGNYTVEAWVYRSALNSGASSAIYDGRQTSGSTTGIAFVIYQDKVVAIWGPNIIFTGSTTILPNQWYHIVICRGGTGTNQAAVFVNGIRDGTFTDSNSYGQGYNVIGAVANSPVGAAPFNGYISNLRIVKGTDVYGYNNTSFTVPTSPLTAITNTTLLTCQSNRFLDNSTTAMAFTASSTPSVQVFSPFVVSTPYSASTNGGSSYYNGSTDYLTTATNTNLQLGTSDFTIEYWAYFISGAAGSTPVTVGGGSAIYDALFGYYSYSGSTALLLWLSSAGSSWDISSNLAIVNPMPFYSWNHVAITRSGSTFRTFFNGALTNTFTNSSSIYQSANSISITRSQGANYFNGYVSDVRFIKGTALYTSAFTPPTTPLTAINNTQFLSNFTNGGINDNSSDVDLVTVSNAQVSTTQSKFGGASLYFDGGSSSYLKSPASVNFQFTGDFTIEFWIYLNSLSGNPTPLDHGYTGSGVSSTGWLLQYASSQLKFYGPVTVASSATDSTSTWYHYAFVRSGSTITIYRNGLNVGSGTSSSALTYDRELSIGGNSQAGSGFSAGAGNINGYIDDLRITNGIARYFYNFQPPTKAHPDSGYSTYTPPTTDSYFGQTTLLLHGDGTNGAQNNTFLDGSSNALTITRNGNATQGTFTPFSRAEGYWSNYFDGSSAYYFSGTGSATPLTFGTSTDFTMEGWFYLNVTSGDSNYRTILSSYDNRTANYGFILGLYTTGTPQFEAYTNGLSLKSTTTLQVGTWYNFAYTRSGSNYYLFLNGVLQATGSGSYNSDNSSNWYVGRIPWASQTGYFNGYISNLRVVKGTALYTANYTPSTTPLTAISGTSLLTCQSNRFKDNSTNAYSVTINNGSPSVQTFIPFEPTTAYSTSLVGGSAYFDGSGDYLNTGTSGQFTASGDFTVSCWFYLQSFAASYYAVAGNWSAGTSDEWLIQIANDGSIRFLTSADGTFSSAGVVKLNQWMYFTATRSGTTITVQVNGTTIRTYTKSDTLGSATKSINIGQQPGNNWPWNGYIADFKLVSGSAITTVPTAPSSSSGTSLLLSCTNGGIIDNTATVDFETLGTAQVSTTQSKFGGSSMYFDGSSYAISSPNQSYALGTSDFTIEYWVYFNSTAANQSGVTFGSGGATYAQALFGWMNSSGGPWVMYLSSNNGAWDIANGVTIIPAALIATGQWYHVAVTRYGSTFRTFCNGNQQATFTSSASIYQPDNRVVLSRYSNPSSYYLNGYLEDVRFTKGISRYNYNFTIPASAYPNS